MNHPLDIVIMAAGKGTRMKSATPKVLQKLAHQGLVQHVLDTAAQLQARKVVVITGHGAEQVEAALAVAAETQPRREFVRQMPQLGTGHAVQQAVPMLDDDGIVVILSGDVPLTQADTVQALVQQCGGDKLALLTLRMENPFGYGRIVRDAYDNVERIVEQKDGTPDELAVKEIYSGIMAAPARLLKQWLGRIDNNNAQNEYYLTDVVKLAVADGVPVLAHVISDAVQVAGVNSPLQLAELEREYQKRQAERLMGDGVRLRDPARFDLRGTLSCGQDVEIDVNCVFEGSVKLGSNVRIGANCVLANCEIGDGAVIHPFTHIDGEKLGVRVGAGALIGPFARLRPGADLGEEVHIGNFVEVKNSTLAKGAKANHLAYLGDATVGERVNYGAGSITANYDGANKHRTVIEADVHIGSNSVLVAPVTIGAGGTVGAGSTIGRDTPPNALSVVRGRLVQKENYQRPVKIKK
ncbi:bifunctional UDP-N-acetylglucosamine diphosphorylase/glucosamine-1-phosphate N-acetyltransferase GlmU [Brachymonas denitrificans]|uniref:bifunctional UDP-N-acetylglucosamine diphosphorylase/glucosamine-1-phosphate N-acetyltransferase GlmU n=1 Tax=Brachymonas denitrificans TaxID=28220 RepID=UPI001BCED813|nr:bifunctional UDP-N-acetylglucosamine diphosphorylase/glucosamine-1-phosphate N-acetyltransferase GlmU [Brachymonas denitrificans]